MKSLNLMLKISFRELRQGKRNFILSIITTALATAMLAAVLGLGYSLTQTLTQDATTILGGHFEIRLNTRDFTEEELDWIRSNSDRTSKLTTVRAAAYTDDLSALIVIRAVDNAYPLFGSLQMSNNIDYDFDLLRQNDTEFIPAVVATDIAGALNLSGDNVFNIGSAKIKPAAFVEEIPDPRSTMLLNAPIVYMAAENLAQTGLDQFGTLKTARLKIDVGERDPILWEEQLDAKFPDNDWRVRGQDGVVENLQEVIGRMETLLLLISLGTLLIAGICVGNSVSTFLRSRAGSIAVLKSLGMSALQIQSCYLFVSLIFVLVGSVIGTAIGYAVQEVIINFLTATLPFNVNSALTIPNLIIVSLIAILTAWIFAVRPLQRFCAISPVMLFSLSSGIDDTHIPDSVKSLRATLIPLIGLLITLVLVSDDRLFLFLFGLGGMAATLLFRFLSLGLLFGLKRYKTRRVASKIAFRSVVRSSSQVSASAASLGVGLSALLLFSLTEANFNNQLETSLANKPPEFYLPGMQPGDEAKIRAATTEWLPTEESFLTVPMNRAKITHLNKVDVESVDWPEEHDWIVHGDRYVTWAKNQSEDWSGTARVSEGEMWDGSSGELLASFDHDAAKSFGLAIGDPIDILINGNAYELKLANLRKIDWSTFDVNFALVMSDGPWSQEPHGYLGSVRNMVGDQHAFQRAVVGVAPSITPIRTENIIKTVTNLLQKISVILNVITITASVAGVMVLAATIAEGRHRRAHDAVVLRMIGTSRATLANVFRFEFIVIACLAVLPALGVAITGGYMITTYLLNIPWNTDWVNAFTVIFATIMTVLILGGLNTRHLVSNPPLTLLRNE